MDSLRSIFKNSFRHSISSVTQVFNKRKCSSDDRAEHLSPNSVALKNALNQCRKEIKKSRRWKIMPSHICFEHAAMLSRQAKNYKNEIKICQLYLSCIDEYLSKRAINKNRTERKARSLCKPFTTRLLIAKKMCKNNGIDVRYLE